MERHGRLGGAALGTVWPGRLGVAVHGAQGFPGPGRLGGAGRGVALHGRARPAWLRGEGLGALGSAAQAWLVLVRLVRARNGSARQATLGGAGLGRVRSGGAGVVWFREAGRSLAGPGGARYGRRGWVALVEVSLGRAWAGEPWRRGATFGEAWQARPGVATQAAARRGAARRRVEGRGWLGSATPGWYRRAWWGGAGEARLVRLVQAR
jgi:hypothetical protein